MKLLTRFFLFALFGLCYTYACAQTPATTIEGKVLTELLQPADAATVKLLNHPDSTLVSATISDINGFFQFRGIKPGNYFISISKVGYRRFYTLKYQVVAHDTLKTTEIRLIALTHQLKEVAIISKKDFVEVRPDKTVINVDKSIVAAGNSVLDVLKQAPGVKLAGDEVLFKGGQKALIAINGRTVLLTGDQLTDLLKSYQSSQVSQVELIANPSAKYDAAGGGVINIVLKKSKDLGLRATITEGASIGDKYKLNSFTALNYRTKNLNLFGTYTYTNNKVPRTWEIDRNIKTPATVAGYNVDYVGTTHLQGHSFSSGADLSINPKQNIGILFNGYINPIGIDKKNTTQLTSNGKLDSTIYTNSFINRHIDNLNYNLNYHGIFGAQGQHTLSADVDYADYSRRSTEDLQNTFYNADGTPYQDPAYFFINSPADITVRSAKVDYALMFTKTNSLEAGVKVSKVKSINRIDFEELQSGGYTLVPSLTDHFIYDEQINAAYVNYNGKFGKVTLNAGLRTEETKANRMSLNPDRQADSSYFNIFPTVQVSYDVNDDHQLTFSYNRRISRPTYQDLNPFVGYIDQYAYSMGNPFSRPQYNSSFEVSDIFLIKFKAALGLIVAKDFYIPIFEQDDASGRYTTTKANVGTRYQYNFELTAPFDITPWWQLNAYSALTYERYVYSIANTGNKSAYDLQLKLTQNFSITKSTKAEVNGSYETPTYYGIKNYREQYYFSAGISQAILNNQGTIRLAVSDIFNTQIDRYNTTFLNLDLKGREKAGTRFFGATFTYRFGNSQLKSARKRSGGATDEQSRMSGSTSEN